MHRVFTRALVGVVMLFPTLAIQGQEATKTQDATTSTTAEIDDPVIIKVFTILHGDATELHHVVQRLFGNSNTSPTPIQNPLLQIRTAVDERTNSLIATGSPEDLQVIEDLLLRLDAKQSPQEQEQEQKHVTRVYHLRNAPASDVADSVNQWLTHRFQSDGTPQDDPAEAVRQKFVIVPELVSNSLIVSTSFDEEQVHELDRVIRALDTPPPTVKISVVLKQTINGKETILSRPQLLTKDNESGHITVGTENDFITLELTPNVIPGGSKPMKVTRIPIQSEDR